MHIFYKIGSMFVTSFVKLIIIDFVKWIGFFSFQVGNLLLSNFSYDYLSIPTTSWWQIRQDWWFCAFVYCTNPLDIMHHTHVFMLVTCFSWFQPWLTFATTHQRASCNAPSLREVILCIFIWNTWDKKRDIFLGHVMR